MEERNYKIVKEEAKKCFINGDYEKALPLYKEAYDLLEGSKKEEEEERKKQLCILKSNIGYVLMKEEKHNKAIPYLQESTKIDPRYEKSYFRLAQCYFEVKNYKLAALCIQKLRDSAKDKAVVALKNKIILRMTMTDSCKGHLNNLQQSLSEENITLVEVREKLNDGKSEEIKISQKSEYKNNEDIELHLFSLMKSLETESKMPVLLKVLYDFFDILKRRPLTEWKELLIEDNYYKMLGLVLKIMIKVSDAKISVYYRESNAYFSQFNALYRYIWDGYLEGERFLKDIITATPLNFREISLLNSISLKLKVNEFSYKEKESEKCKKINLFFRVLCTKFKRLVDVEDPYFKKIESRTIKEEKEIIVEFLERVSRSNSNEAKSFMVAFLKFVQSVYNGKISKLLLGEMAHLYKDHFSFQSILLMNCLILSDFPDTVDDLSETQPVFIVIFSKIFLIIFLAINLPLDRAPESPRYNPEHKR